MLSTADGPSVHAPWDRSVAQPLAMTWRPFSVPRAHHPRSLSSVLKASNSESCPSHAPLAGFSLCPPLQRTRVIGLGTSIIPDSPCFKVPHFDHFDHVPLPWKGPQSRFGGLGRGRFEGPLFSYHSGLDHCSFRRKLPSRGTDSCPNPSPQFRPQLGRSVSAKPWLSLLGLGVPICTMVTQPLNEASP